jgi:hypothetical protein
LRKLSVHPSPKIYSLRSKTHKLHTHIKFCSLYIRSSDLTYEVSNIRENESTWKNINFHSLWTNYINFSSIFELYTFHQYFWKRPRPCQICRRMFGYYSAGKPNKAYRDCLIYNCPRMHVRWQNDSLFLIWLDHCFNWLTCACFMQWFKFWNFEILMQVFLEINETAVFICVLSTFPYSKPNKESGTGSLFLIRVEHFFFQTSLCLRCMQWLKWLILVRLE